MVRHARGDNRIEVVVCYTDGSSIGNPGPSAWAYLMYDETISGRVPCATNNQMEMVAIIKAINGCDRAVNLHVVSDSKIALGMIMRRWKGANPILQALRDEAIHTAFLKCIRLSGQLIKGHAGNRWNNMVDERARLESKREQSSQLATAKW